MDWIEISVQADGEAAEAVSELFNRLNSRPDGQGGAVIEVGGFDPVGEDYRPTVIVKTYLPADAAETAGLQRQLEEGLWHLGRIYPLGEVLVRRLAEEDWANAWKSSYKPLRIGHRFLVIPAWLTDEIPDEVPDEVPGTSEVPGTLGLLPIILDPGMAFGTGLHPSTQLCLMAMEDVLRPGERVLDAGCGSGILSIGAVRLGARQVDAFDIDPIAVRATEENAALNELSLPINAVVSSGPGEDPLWAQADGSRPTWDVILVNILPHVIIGLLESGLHTYLAPGGRVILAGIIEERESEVCAALAEQGLSVVKRLSLGDWVSLVGTQEASVSQASTIPKRGMTQAYSMNAESQSTLKEQLRLFAFDEDMASSLDTVAMQEIRRALDGRGRLTALLEGELNFHGEDSGYASHDLHAFAAKFPPQLPRAFIRGLTNPGDIVLDPMMGSGTTVVEALLEGRRGIGLDIDPLALRLGRVKTMPLDIDELRNTGNHVLKRATDLLSDGDIIERLLNSRFDEPTKSFVDYWFLPDTQRELEALALSIREIQDAATRRFFELAFSAIIVTKSGGVSRARDLAHSRPHLDKTKIPKSALAQFAVRVRKNLFGIAQLRNDDVRANTLTADARSIPLADCSVDLIVTSPPYANAIDYMRAHKFSLVWLGDSVADLSKLRAGYIGSERISHAWYCALPSRPESIIRQLAERDRGKAAVLRKYYVEMQTVIAEMYRVLRNGAPAIVVVGTSSMRDIDVQTHLCLADIADSLGFDVAGVVQRTLDRDRRMMPARFGKKTDSMIEQRMHEEFVVGLLKP